MNPNSFKPECNLAVDVPCNGRGTYDAQDFRYQPGRDDVYDCEPDATCVCRRGYQGAACEIGEWIILLSIEFENVILLQNAGKLKQTSS
jgi:hypothetical protein